VYTKNKTPYIIDIQRIIIITLTFWWSCRESNPGPNKQQNRFLHA